MMKIKKIREQDHSFKIDKRSIKNISKSIAGEIADRIYHKFLLARYMPEVLSIEKDRIIPIKIEDFKQQLLCRINSKDEI